jgi:hypothetical protein
MERTLDGLRDEIIKRLDEKYYLTEVGRSDELTDDQVAALARGDMESFYEKNDDWEMESRSEGARYYTNDLLDDVIRDWEREDDRFYRDLAEDFKLTEEWWEVVYAIEERDASDPYKQLALNTGAVLMRVGVSDEDSAYAWGSEPPTPEQVLTDVGLPVTENNIKVMNSVLAEVSFEYSGAVASWLFPADPWWLYELPQEPETIIEIEHPYLWLGNPWQGDGWVNEKPFDGTVRIKRGDLRTDKDNWGYGWNDVVGGVYLGAFDAAEVRVVQEKEESK